MKIVAALVPAPAPAAASTSDSRFAATLAAAFDSADAPAFNTSAHAVPSGYFNTPCCATINARRSGIIINTPSNPPNTATNVIRANSKSNPKIMIAGIVTPTPNAIDSPADPPVCTMLFSKIVASRPPNFPHSLNNVIEITATGIDALTVNPTFNTKYNDDAPNTIPSSAPSTNGATVNSRKGVSGEM